MTFSARRESLRPGGRALRRLRDRRSSGHSKIGTHRVSLRLEGLGRAPIGLQSGGRLCISCPSFLIVRSVLAGLLGYGLATDAQTRSNRPLVRLFLCDTITTDDDSAPACEALSAGLDVRAPLVRGRSPSRAPPLREPVRRIVERRLCFHGYERIRPSYCGTRIHLSRAHRYTCSSHHEQIGACIVGAIVLRRVARQIPVTIVLALSFLLLLKILLKHLVTKSTN